MSVAQLKVLKDVRVLDCSTDHSAEFIWHDSEPSPEEREKAVWREVNQSFSEPVASERPATEYLPTQIIAEFFRNQGAHGIVYQSLLGDGKNIALFNIEDADVINCSLHCIKGVKFSYEQAANPYFVPKHY